jgi:hypothetical protein
MTTVKKEKACYNPMFLDGKKIDSFVFFDPKTQKEVISTRWFHGGGSNNEYQEITFPFDIRRANKTDLSKNESFYNTGKDGLKIYISIELPIGFTEKGEEKIFSSEYQDEYKSEYSFMATAIKTCYRITAEEEIEYYDDENKELEISISGYYRTQRTKKGEHVDQIAKLMKDNNIDFYAYEMEKAMEFLNISIK